MKRRKVDLVRILERAGLHDLATEASRRFDEVVDEEQLEAFMQTHGVNRDVLINRMGGSP